MSVNAPQELREFISFELRPPRKGERAAFLAGRGFCLVEHLAAEDIERRFLTLRDGTRAERVTADSCLVLVTAM